MNSHTIIIIARILITPLFLYSGSGKIINFTDNVLKTPFGDMLIGKLMIIFAIAIELGGSIAFIMGYRVKEISLLWIFYILLTSIMFHPFWAASGPQQAGQMIQFTKNMSICAGLLCFYLLAREQRKS